MSTKTASRVPLRIRPLAHFWQKIQNDWSFQLAGMLAYNFLIALLPIFIAMIAILGFLLGTDQSETFIKQILTIFPSLSSQEETLNLAVSQLAKNAGILALLATVIALFGGSRFFIVMEKCLNIIYRAHARKFIQKNLVALGMLLIFIVLIPIIIFASTLPTALLGLLSNQPQLSAIPFFQDIIQHPFVLYIVGVGDGLIASFFFFISIYLIVPNIQLRWRYSWRGALFSAIALQLYLQLFPLYIYYFMDSYSSQIGFAVILLIFLYYFAIILLLGAEVNASLGLKLKPLPDNVGNIAATYEETTETKTEEPEQRVTTRTTKTKPKSHATRSYRWLNILMVISATIVSFILRIRSSTHKTR